MGGVVCSLAPMLEGTREAPQEPHAYRDVDVVIVPAQFGVAENGAVWIDGATVPVRAALFLAQHLVVLLPQGEIVDNMHDAYERIGARLGQSAFGCFMSGPSKTADIEQALVVGAHGPRSLTIVEY
jgi:L-lactate dehydrogenase complex protein LldG